MEQSVLHIFLELAENLHFRAASRACNISPSALSRQIQRLEEVIGRRLFIRNNRSVQLTDAGRLFLRYARRELALWREFDEELRRDEKILRGEISIYCSVTASLSMLPEALTAFRLEAPVVNIRLLTGDAGSAVEKVMSGEVDFAVSARPEVAPDDFAFYRLAEIELVFVAPATPWEFSAAIDAGDPYPWRQIPLILGQSGMARMRIDSWLREQGIEPQIYAQVAGNEGILPMVALGCGVGVVPRPVLDESPLKHRLQRVQPAHRPQRYDVGVCARRSRLSGRLQAAFWAALQGAEPERGGGQ